jgi:hypothetical protein
MYNVLKTCSYSLQIDVLYIYKFNNVPMSEERRNKKEITNRRALTTTLDRALAGPRGNPRGGGAILHAH